MTMLIGTFSTHGIYITNDLKPSLRAIMNVIKKITNVEDKADAIWAQVMMRGGLIPLIVATLMDLPRLYVLRHDIDELKQEVLHNPAFNINNFVPTLVFSQDPQKRVIDGDINMKPYMETLNYILESQFIKMTCLNEKMKETHGLTTSADFMQNSKVSKMVDKFVLIAHILIGEIMSEDELKDFFGYVIFAFHREVISVSNNIDLKIAPPTAFLKVMATLRTMATAFRRQKKY